MRNVVLYEVFFVVFLLVETNNSGYAKLLENLDVLFGVVTITLICIPFLYGSHKCHEFTRNDPVGVAIFDSLVILVLFYIECSEIVPLELDGVLQALKALQ